MLDTLGSSRVLPLCFASTQGEAMFPKPVLLHNCQCHIFSNFFSGANTRSSEARKTEEKFSQLPSPRFPPPLCRARGCHGVDDAALVRSKHVQGELQLPAGVDDDHHQSLCCPNGNFGGIQLPRGGTLHNNTWGSFLRRMGHCCFQISGCDQILLCFLHDLQILIAPD